MQAGVAVHTSSTLAYNAAQGCLPGQHKLIYKESVSLKPNDDTRKAEKLLMQAPSSQPCPAERALDVALAGFVQQTPGLASDIGLETKLMQLVDKGVMMTTSDKKAVLLIFLGNYANPLPLKEQSIPPKILIQAVKQSGQHCVQDHITKCSLRAYCPSCSICYRTSQVEWIYVVFWVEERPSQSSATWSVSRYHTEKRHMHCSQVHFMGGSGVYIL